MAVLFGVVAVVVVGGLLGVGLVAIAAARGPERLVQW